MVFKMKKNNIPNLKYKELNNIETKIISERRDQKLGKILNIYYGKIEYKTNDYSLQKNQNEIS